MQNKAWMRVIIAVTLLLSSAKPAITDNQESAHELFIERDQLRLIVRGDISSAGHEQLLRQSAAQQFPDNAVELDLNIRSGLPPAWSLVTNLTLRALADTSVARATITPGRIAISGFTNDLAAWRDAVAHLEKYLPPEVTLDSAVTAPEPTSSLESACQTVFAAAFRAQRIVFAVGSKTLSSSAYGLLDELTELGADCPVAAMLITGSGDGGPANEETGRQRAVAVMTYLTNRGFDATRLTARGATASANRIIVFSVRF